MEPVKALVAQSSTGQQVSVRIETLGIYPHRLGCTREDGTETEYEEYEAGNFFRCLALLREDLETEGFLLCCQGARLNIFQSGLQIQMSDGLYAYECDAALEGMSQREVYIFDPAPFAEVGTVEEQRQAIYAFHGLPDPNPQRPRT